MNVSVLTNCFLAVVLATVGALAFAHERGAGLTRAELKGGSTLRVVRSDAKALVSLTTATAPEGKQLKIDRPLMAALSRTDGLAIVSSRDLQQQGSTYFVMGLSLPSVRRQGPGFCGAGTEDWFYLVELKSKSQLLVRDRLLIQSCLKSISLSTDRGENVFAVLAQVETPAHIDLSWSSPTGQLERKTLVVDGGKFLVLDR